MIRRIFWLAIGAVLGITGYRRLTKAAKSLLPRTDALVPLSRRTAGAVPARRAPGRGTGAGTAAFVRDVRTGMAEYMDRHRDI